MHVSRFLRCVVRITYRLVPVGVTTGDHVTELIESFRDGDIFGISARLRSHGTGHRLGLDNFLFLLCCWRRRGRWCRGSGLGL
jgi:hypothetical protein